MSVVDVGPSRSPGLESLRVSVVICAYSDLRWRLLREAVEAIARQSPSPHQLIVVIDHNDELLRRARSEFPGATVIANLERQGLSGARNSGVAAATGDLVAFVDDDACPRPGWLAQIAAAFDDASVIGVGGVAEPRWEAGAPSWIPAEFYWVVGCSYRGLPQHPVEIRNPIGANMAFRREVFSQVGGFTDGIGRVGRTPLGCEETEFSIRAVGVTGGRILQIPRAAVDHLVPVDRTRWRYFQRRCWAEGLSKAVVAQSVGSDMALQSERGYVIRTLPAGVLRGLTDLLRGDPGGLARAAAIVAGLLLTTAGYARGRLAANPVRHP